ncbi:MAG: 16S rRNA (cytidine(1402)-2'-O)-methyltransferase [Gemmatimonadaceae bacterium]|nr:16S rRNA (cytidine(1402)-2'-O)-methyltransferase [Gloeobacterales cyanobacterium ES-bin-141]
MSVDAGAAGTLYLVATPIGNLQDITLRALQILKQCDHIACEDTRHSRKLLTHYEIHKPLLSYHTHNAHRQLTPLLDRLRAGEQIALITDAGMPMVCDPGTELVKACHAMGIPVVVVPGASALTAALAAVGEPGSRFVFEGFLPATGVERRARLAAIGREERTVVLFEPPHRVVETLAALLALGPPERAISICRELTKIHEQIWQGSLREAVEYFNQNTPRGEFTLVLAGAAPVERTLDPEQLRSALQLLLAEGHSRSEASRQLAEQTGLARRSIYQLSLGLSPVEDIESDIGG